METASPGEILTLCVEQALKYPADIVYVDDYGTLKTTEVLRAQPSYGAMPSGAATQTGEWLRDSPLPYAVLTNFLKQVPVPIQSAEKVSRSWLVSEDIPN